LESLFLGGLVFVLLALAAFYGWRQWLALGRLRNPGDMSAEEQRYIRRMAHRRLTASAFMVLGAGLLAGTFWLTPRAMEISAKKRDFLEGKAVQTDTQEDEQFVRFYTLYWIGFLLVLLIILVLAGIDLFATRRFGISQHLKIQADRRAMIEQEALRLRQDRNGHH
jgi:hypothetical protein